MLCCLSFSIGGYDIEKESLGAGAFGEVFKGRKNGDIYAIKKISAASSKDRDKIAKEVAAMKNLENPNVVRFMDSFDAKGYVYIVMEFCNGGSLNSYILENRTAPADKLGFINQLAKGLRYLYANEIVHRDIKPDNIMIQNNDTLVIKLADFGLAILWEIDDCMSASQAIYYYSACGPKYYTAPEVLRGKVTMKSDIFSMGCVIMALFAETTVYWAHGKLLLAPYIDTPENQISDATKNEKRAYVKRHILIQVDQTAFQDLVYDMVQTNWRDRPNADEAYQRAYDIIGANVSLTGARP
ncbi:hypothetical protein SNE40_008030 [Patella caerulea]|uniref:Protein kinase domain-containing protein n=1 Tax=Patella caerulea TaxID=87958 RepID=A0AAN8PUJ3_PATCE